MSAADSYVSSPAPISSPDLSDKLSQKTTVFGLKLWVIIGTSVGVFMVLMIILILSIWLIIARKKLKSMDTSVTSSSTHKSSAVGRGVAATPANFTVYSSPIPLHSREIKEVMILNQNGGAGFRGPVAAAAAAVPNVQLSIDIHSAAGALPQQHHINPAFTTYSIRTVDQNGHLEPSRFIRSVSKNGTATVGDNYSIANVDDGEHSAATNGINELQLQSTVEHQDHHHHQQQQQENVAFNVPDCYPELSHLGWGHWFTLRDMQNATQGFCREHVLGEGGYGIVYKGRLPNGSMIAVKSLLNNMGQAEREFRVEMEAIGRARHKNLVKYLGYCIEGTHRMLVYEFVENGSLEQWLHHHSHATDGAGQSQLTWDSRVKIVIGIAKALAYLHEALEPRVVHRDIKASNILLDSEWNAKLSDFGLAKLLDSDKSHVTTRVMGTFGYVAPEYASSGILSEKSDVYSFGVLLLEVITGRDPVDYARPAGEVNLVDWLKVMVGHHRAEEVVDPRLSERPAPRVLKKVLLIALRCIDPEADRRPKMGHVVHMLESDSIPYREIAMTTTDWRPSEGR